MVSVLVVLDQTPAEFLLANRFNAVLNGPRMNRFRLLRPASRSISQARSLGTSTFTRIVSVLGTSFDGFIKRITMYSCMC